MSSVVLVVLLNIINHTENSQIAINRCKFKDDFKNVLIDIFCEKVNTKVYSLISNLWILYLSIPYLKS
jgi:hypothetical protein